MYVTREQVEAEIPPPLIIEALDDDKDGAEDEGLFDQVVANACKAVDSPLAALYTVPFEAPFPPVAEEAAFVFVCETLYRRRGTPDDMNPFFKRAEGLRKRLQAIGKGEEKLDATQEKNFTPGAAVTEPVTLDSSLR